MVRHRVAGSALACVLVASLFSRSGRADCGPPPADHSFIYPADLQQDVALDTKIFTIDFIREVRLDGQSLRTSEVGIWDPGGTLEPNRVYELEFTPWGGQPWQTSFKTGTEPFASTQPTSASLCLGSPDDANEDTCVRMGGNCIDVFVPYDSAKFTFKSCDAVFWVLTADYTYFAISSCADRAVIPFLPSDPVEATAYAPNGDVLFSRRYEDGLISCDQAGDDDWSCPSGPNDPPPADDDPPPADDDPPPADDGFMCKCAKPAGLPLDLTSASTFILLARSLRRQKSGGKVGGS